MVTFIILIDLVGMVTVCDPLSSLILSLVCMSSLFSGSDAATSTGIVSGNCSTVTWPNITIMDTLNLFEEIPVPFNIDLLDVLCENPSCRDAGVWCEIGNCSTCVPITADYSNRIIFTLDTIDGVGAQPLEGNVKCSVGPQNTSNPSHYSGTCTAENHLVNLGNYYYIVTTIMSLDNTTVMATLLDIISFWAGNPVPEKTWAEFADPPVSINHKNMLRLCLKDGANNTVSAITGNTCGAPIAFSVVVTTMRGEPAALQIPPEPDSYSERGYYLTPIIPVYTGDYIATITTGNVHISNSPLYFTAGETFGIPVRNTSSSTPLIPAGLLSCLLMVSSTFVTCLVY